jgi:hypothetical protein
MEEPKEVGQIDPKTTVQATGIQPPIHERIVPLNHHEPFALEAIHIETYRIRFITNARHPAKSPPPKMVVANET